MSDKAEPASTGGSAAENFGGCSVADSSRIAQGLATPGGAGGCVQADATQTRVGGLESRLTGAICAPHAVATGGADGLGNRATSNSTVDALFQPFRGLWACLDRLSFCGRVKDAELPAFRRWWGFSGFVTDPRGSRTPGFRQSAVFAGVGVVEVGDKASGAGSSNSIKVRFDFNPQKVPTSALMELAAFLYPESLTFTRVDVALDYTVALGDCLADHDTLRKCATYGAGADCSGWTFGSRRGGRYTRVYDKRREREESKHADDRLLAEIGDAPLWRIEVEARPHGGEVLPLGLFDGLHLRNASTEPLDYKELAIFRACVADAGYLKRIPSKNGTRAKYRALLDNHTSELSPSPAAVYESVRDELLAELTVVRLLVAGAVEVKGGE